MDRAADPTGGSSASPGRPRAGRRTFARSILGGKLRRAYLTAFRPGYVAAQERRRRGACRQCGNCCRLVHRCFFLTRDNLCRLYGLWRPANCVRFPIDERDIRDAGGTCGFYFEDESAEGEPGAK
jgi:hypothetical protein